MIWIGMCPLAHAKTSRRQAELVLAILQFAWKVSLVTREFQLYPFVDGD
jgi:hypothetical protein